MQAQSRRLALLERGVISDSEYGSSVDQSSTDSDSDQEGEEAPSGPVGPPEPPADQAVEETSNDDFRPPSPPRVQQIAPALQARIQRVVGDRIRKNKKIKRVHCKCGTVCDNRKQLLHHQNGKKCKARLERITREYLHLQCCGRTFASRHDFDQHLRSRKCKRRKNN